MGLTPPQPTAASTESTRTTSPSPTTAPATDPDQSFSQFMARMVCLFKNHTKNKILTNIINFNYFFFFFC